MKDATRTPSEDLKQGPPRPEPVPPRLSVLLAQADNDPLIQLARRPGTSARRRIHDAIDEQPRGQWEPEHIKDGRMGDFLANNVDWALSRERYWGTPLNVWINDKSGKMEAPSSVDEILKKNPKAFDHFHAAKKADPTSTITSSCTSRDRPGDLPGERASIAACRRSSTAGSTAAACRSRSGATRTRTEDETSLNLPRRLHQRGRSTRRAAGSTRSS